jgi:hypothetical protein
MWATGKDPRSELENRGGKAAPIVLRTQDYLTTSLRERSVPSALSRQK